jgi:RNA polymerase sigma-70 factor, ECF subfamily
MSSSAATPFPSLPLSDEIMPGSTSAVAHSTALAALSDEVLMARVCSGEREALACLFRRFASLVRGVSLRILRDEAEAEDLVQELFLFIHSKAGLYDSSKSSARSWIVQMTYRRAISRWRYLNARGHYKNAEMDCCNPSLASAAAAEYDSSIEALFGRKGLKKVMEELSSEQHETLRLHFYDGFTLAEISAKLGQPLGNVRHHYYRGLEKLRKQVRSLESQTR